MTFPVETEATIRRRILDICRDQTRNVVEITRELALMTDSVGDGKGKDAKDLIFRVGEIADYAQGIGFRLSAVVDKSWKMDRKYMKRLSDLISLVLEEMSKIRETMMSLGFNPTKAMELSRTVEDTERKVDTAYRSFDLEVLDEKMPLRSILIMRDLSAQMENMADLGVDVVDLIRVIALTA